MNFERETGVSRESGVVRKSRLVPTLVLLVTVFLFLASKGDRIAGLAPHDELPLALSSVTEHVEGATSATTEAVGEAIAASRPVAEELALYAKTVVDEFSSFFVAQVLGAGVLVLFALFPGLAGLVYRRAFWPWFLLAFVILFVIHGLFLEVDAPGRELSHGFHLFLESQVVFLVLAGSLRRHVAVASPRSTGKNLVLPAVLTLVAAFVVYLLWTWSAPLAAWKVILWLEACFGLLWTAWALWHQRHEEESTPKNIVLCMDGTWNYPGQTDFGYLAQTNVFKLYSLLAGERTRTKYNASRSKVQRDARGKTRQVGLYFHGVGNRVENSSLGQLVGGAFGMGAAAIVERAYLDVVRVYKPGDRIFVFGFSRGAAIARLIAGALCRRQVPQSLWTVSLFGRRFAVWKSHGRFEDVQIEVLGCWDTVGAFGLAKNVLGIPFQRINLLKDLTVADCVKRAYHMVALDETRDAFVPTLMDPDPTDPARIVEVWFPGNHSNVGGGYATDGLSDLALDFCLRHVSSGYSPESERTTGDESWGLLLKKDHEHGIRPDPKGQIRFSTGPIYQHAPRVMPLPSVVHDSVFERMKDPGSGYAPRSVFALADSLVERQRFIAEEVGNLGRTDAFTEDEAQRVVAGSLEYLRLKKWSTLRERLGASLAPERALRHAPVGASAPSGGVSSDR